MEQRTVLGVGHEEIKRRDHRVLNRIDLPLEWPPRCNALGCMVELVDRIKLCDDGVWVTLKIRVPCSRAGVQTSSILGLSRFVPLKMKRGGVETRVIIAAGDEPPRKVDSALLKAVARARVWFDELASGRVRSLAEIARKEGIAKRYVERLSRRAFVTPAVVEAICQGQQPQSSTPRRCATASISRSNGRRNATLSVSSNVRFQLHPSDAVVFGHSDRSIEIAFGLDLSRGQGISATHWVVMAMVSREEQKMKFESLKPWVLAAVIAFLVVDTCDLSAQEAATALSSTQQSAAKSALCSAIASKFPNPAAAGPSALSDHGVLSTAASSFAGSTHLPLPSATDMIKAYAMQHATDILGSCATGTGTSGVIPQIPGASGLPSIPKLP